MKTLTIDYSKGGNGGKKITYKLIEDGQDLPIAYHEETPDKLIQVMERLRKNRTRIKLHYGDIETGRDWNEENDVTGYICLSRGHKARFPILVHNERSYGGGAILDHCIIKIKSSKGDTVFYQAANYKQPEIKVIPSDLPEYVSAVQIDGQLYSRHKTIRAAKMLAKKLM